MSLASAMGVLRNPRQRGQIALFLANFAFAKLAIYFVPLAIAALAAPSLYAAVELAQSTGMLVGALLVTAPLAGITQRYLVSRDGSAADVTAFVLAAGSGAALLAFALTRVLGAGANAQLVAASLAAATSHLVAGSTFRMLGWRNLSAWVDGTAILLGGVALLLVVVSPAKSSVAALTWSYAGIALALFAIAAVATVKTAEPRLAARLLGVSRVGLPIMIVATMAMWIGMGGRILIGFLDPAALAAYGFAFRIAGLALGVHQLVMTSLFARLYAARTKAVDPILAAFLAVVAALSLAIAVFGRFVPQFVAVNALSNGGTELYYRLLPLTALHTYFWIGYGMLQFRISRYRLAARAILPTAAVTLAGIAIILSAGLMFGRGAVLVSWLIAAHAATYFLKNSVILARAALPHKWTTVIGFGGGAALVGAALLPSPV